jgi:hydrogenase nickel incorporation protein HypA/HybF
MHEMSLAESMREIVEEAARANGATSVTLVRLRIGRLAPVEVDALRFCFDVVTNGTVAHGATLEIEASDGSAWCWDCSATVTVAGLAEPCPACGGQRLEVTGGTEMRVHEIELGPAVEAIPCA